MIFLYVLVYLVFDSLLGVFRTKGQLLYSIVSILEFLFFAAFFYLSIRNPVFKKVILGIAALNTIAEILLLSTSSSIYDFWTAITTAVFIVGFAIFFFYEQVNSSQTMLIYQSYKFWVAVGCILYLSGTLFLFLYTSGIKDKQNSAFWFINVFFEIVKDVCFCVSFLVARNYKENLLAENSYDTNMFEKPF